MIGEALVRLRRSEALDPALADAVFADLLDGRLDAAQTGALLMGLAQKGETVEELAAAARAMRARMIRAQVRADAIDVCGTGGDGAGTFNISTAVAIVVAACGVPVAKHGNRAASSQSGATDVLTQLGVRTDAPQPVVERCVNELGIGYFAAPLYHPALAPLVPVRKALGIRTLFNLIGPLCNPAGVTRQMLGVPDPALVKPMRDVLQALGSTAMLIVSGGGGIDEFSLAGDNGFATQDGGPVRRINASELGFNRAPIEALRGGTPQINAAALRTMLAGERGAYRDTVLLNAAFALALAQESKAQSTLSQATETIDSGRALALLDRWAQMSHQS